MEPEDLEDYSVAGCQEPLIMGKDNGNTTNSWLNMAKVLELSLNGGVSRSPARSLAKATRKTDIRRKWMYLRISVPSSIRIWMRM